ncbi:MAG: hypothetical protein L3J91_04810, partial [Thermoplasmata archaeon]|nr:hypothetical protein [Thermoplasmata archaeon]
ALLELAKIVRVADGGWDGAVPAAAWKAAADGFRAAARDDLENQRLQFPLYDARYEHGRLRLAPSGTERLPPKVVAGVPPRAVPPM